MHYVLNHLLDEAFGGTFHEDLSDAERPLFLYGMQWVFWVSVGGDVEDLSDVVFHRPWHNLLTRVIAGEGRIDLVKSHMI